jgi:hypothetical protein
LTIFAAFHRASSRSLRMMGHLSLNLVNVDPLTQN